LIGPEKIEKLSSKSVAVLQLIDPPTVPLEPMIKPTRVTVTAIPAASALPVAANTMEVAPGCPGISVAPAVDTLAEGVAEVAKKPDG
jgi:hypothetical protein